MGDLWNPPASLRFYSGLQGDDGQSSCWLVNSVHNRVEAGEKSGSDHVTGVSPLEFGGVVTRQRQGVLPLGELQLKHPLMQWNDNTLEFGR